MLIETRKKIANLISNILNPFLVSLILILLLSFEATSNGELNVLDALRWSLILIALSILPVYLAIIYLVRSGGLDSVFTNVRRQRLKIYLLAGGWAAVGCVVLLYLKAPPRLMAASVAGLSTVVIFMCINLWWKISLHTAFIAASVTLLVILYGWVAVVAIVLIPLMFWARMELKRHSLAQVAAGALLSTLIVAVVFRIFLPWYEFIYFMG